MNSIEFYGNYQVYSDSGVDLTLLRENLKRPFEARLLANSRLVKFSEALAASNPYKDKSAYACTMIELDAPGILRRLNDHQVEYVLVGGLAMLAQGSAYVTKDIDICYGRSPGNIAALAKALEAIHPYLRGAPAGLPFRLDVPTIQAGLNFTLVTELGDVDLLGEVKGIGDFSQVLAQAEQKNLYGMIIQVLSLDGLIAAKKAAARRKDQLHLLELEELKKLRQNPQP